MFPPTGAGVGMPKRRGKWLTRDVPIFLGGIVSLSTFLVFGMGSLIGGAGLLSPALGAIGVGAAVAGGAAYLLRNRRPAQQPIRAVSGAVPEGTRALLEGAAGAALTQRQRIADLSQRRSSPQEVKPVLARADALLVRIDALLRTEVVQSRRPYDEDVMLLEGMSVRYITELLAAVEDNAGFLSSVSGGARQQALQNLQVIDQQLAALSDGVDRIEGEVIGGAARSLEVQQEFLRTRLGSTGGAWPEGR